MNQCVYVFMRVIFLLQVGIFQALASTDSQLTKEPKENVHQVHNVFIYTTNDSCDKCKEVSDLLERHNVAYKKVDLSWNPKQHMLIKRQTKQPAPPYIFIGNKFIGGHEELKTILKKQKFLPKKKEKHLESKEQKL